MIIRNELEFLLRLETLKPFSYNVFINILSSLQVWNPLDLETCLLVFRCLEIETLSETLFYSSAYVSYFFDASFRMFIIFVTAIRIIGCKTVLCPYFLR